MDVVYIWKWSSAHALGASVVWHYSLLLINGFNKTNTAVFSCRLCFLMAFPFISLMVLNGLVRLNRTFPFISLILLDLLDMHRVYIRFHWLVFELCSKLHNLNTNYTLKPHWSYGDRLKRMCTLVKWTLRRVVYTVSYDTSSHVLSRFCTTAYTMKHGHDSRTRFSKKI